MILWISQTLNHWLFLFLFETVKLSQVCLSGFLLLSAQTEVVLLSTGEHPLVSQLRTTDQQFDPVGRSFTSSPRNLYRKPQPHPTQLSLGSSPSLFWSVCHIPHLGNSPPPLTLDNRGGGGRAQCEVQWQIKENTWWETNHIWCSNLINLLLSITYSIVWD